MSLTFDWFNLFISLNFFKEIILFINIVNNFRFFHKTNSANRPLVQLFKEDLMILQILEIKNMRRNG